MIKYATPLQSSPLKAYDDLAWHEKCIHDTIVNANGERWNHLCEQAYRIYKENPAMFDYKVWSKVHLFVFGIHFVKDQEVPMGCSRVEYARMIDTVTGTIIKHMREEIELGNHGEI